MHITVCERSESESKSERSQSRKVTYYMIPAL